MNDRATIRDGCAWFVEKGEATAHQTAARPRLAQTALGGEPKHLTPLASVRAELRKQSVEGRPLESGGIPGWGAAQEGMRCRVVHPTRAEAEADSEHFDGTTTE